jgi:hypothetical protein
MPKREPMPDDQTITLAPALACEECHVEWTDPTERWRIYVLPDEPAEPLIYCPACASREFGD